MILGPRAIAEMIGEAKGQNLLVSGLLFETR